MVPIDPHNESGAYGIAAAMRQSCRLVFTSSLHGLVFADALRIPALAASSHARRFKFQDYAAGVSRRLRAENVAPSIGAALARMEAGTLPLPRLSTEFLQRFARQYVELLPWTELCARPGSSREPGAGGKT